MISDPDFEHALLLRPYDGLVRLIYSDWLQEQVETRCVEQAEEDAIRQRITQLRLEGETLMSRNMLLSTIPPA